MKLLRVRQVDLVNRRIEIHRGRTKGGEARRPTMPLVLSQLIKTCCEGKGPDELVFTRQRKDGRRVAVGSFRKLWEHACKEIGRPDLHVHDLRRTAARNVIDAGIDEQTAMEIGGCRTPSIFRRYNLGTQKRLDEAACKLQRFREFGDSLGTVPDKTAQKPASKSAKSMN